MLRLLLATTVWVFTLGACSGVQVDSGPIKEFKQGNYKTYSWRAVPSDLDLGSNKPLDYLDPALHAAVDLEMAEKGYILLSEGGDFVIDHQIRMGLADGAVNRIITDAEDSSKPLTTTNAVINRDADPALVDNARALSGPRPLASIELSFTDTQSHATLWSVSLSRVVENTNAAKAEAVVKKLKRAVPQALRKLPRAD